MLAREERYRDHFCLHLQVRTERSTPSPIFVAALLGTERLRIVYLSQEINSLEEDERNEIIGDAVQRHYREAAGDVPAFGRIVSYYFVRFAGFGADDFGTEYDVTGRPIGEMVTIRRVPEATLGTKHGDTRFTGLLENDLIENNPILEICTATSM